jgi:cytochrome bd ubiquinol oxidase subunit I
MTNVWALFVNPTFIWGYAHVILASLITGCLVMLAVLGGVPAQRRAR